MLLRVGSHADLNEDPNPSISAAAWRMDNRHDHESPDKYQLGTLVGMFFAVIERDNAGKEYHKRYDSWRQDVFRTK